MQTALQALIDLGGTAKRSEVFKSVEPRLEFNEYERSLNDSGYPRWRTSIGWWSTDVAKAGWILKKNGKWHITNEGQAALALEPGEFIRQAADAYRKQLDNSAPDTTEVATVTEEEVATEEF